MNSETSESIRAGYCKCYIKGIMTEEMKAEYERLLKQLEVVQQLEAEIKKKLIKLRENER